MDNYLTRLSVFIHCPVLIDGKVGQLGVSYGMNINVKQFRAAYGNNGPPAEELMAELTAQIKPSIESLQIHLPGVSHRRQRMMMLTEILNVLGREGVTKPWYRFLLISSGH